jgi:phosphoribosylanthranilate isomerase
MTAPRIKICCIASPEEAALAISFGASALGLVSAMPSGPGPIDEAAIAEIVRHVPPGVSTFLLTSLTNADAIIEQQRRCRCNVLQLVDAVTIPTYVKLRRALPGIGIVQVVHVVDNDAAGEALDIAPHVDALLLDSGNPRLAVKELGGTGRVHDWSISRYIVERCGKPVYLAGGLNSANVGDAIAHVRPFGIDLCSGLRTDGQLDATRVRAFTDAVRAASAGTHA